MGGVGEWAIILAIVIILFGARKLPDLANSVGQSIKEFRKATADDEDGEQTEASTGSSRDDG